MSFKDKIIIWATEQEVKHPEWAEAMNQLRVDAEYLGKANTEITAYPNYVGSSPLEQAINYARNSQYYPYGRLK